MIPLVISVTPYEMSACVQVVTVVTVVTGVKGCALLLGRTGATVFLKNARKFHICALEIKSISKPVSTHIYKAWL